MKKNLLFIIDNLKGGGAERILITILQHLDVWGLKRSDKIEIG